MTEEARLYGTVLYELKVPQEMVKKTGEILERNPEWIYLKFIEMIHML